MKNLKKNKRETKNNQYSKQDVYLRKAKQEGYRARSAYKLLHINDIFDIFSSTNRVLDLCGAPGSWTQVCVRKLQQNGAFNKQNGKVVCVDLQQVIPIPHVHHIVGDITRKQTVMKIMQAFDGTECDLVICDGAPDVTGFHDIDQYIQSQLLIAALHITIKLLKDGGRLVIKIFKGCQIGFLYSQFKMYFRQIHIMKPKSSRDSSVQHFLIGLDFQRELLSKNNILNIELSTFYTQINSKDTTNCLNHRKIFGYVTSGDLSSYDQQIKQILKESQLSQLNNNIPKVQQNQILL